MQLSESLIETQRRRLPGQTESVIKSTGIGGLAAFMLGILTILFGTVVTLIGLKIIPYAPSDIYAPYWVLVTFGGIFVFAGLTLWIQVLLEYLFQRRCRKKATKHPRFAAYADYLWNPKE